jgi:HK97 family phage portal protein
MGWLRRKEERSWSISDPVFAEYFGIAPQAAGVAVTEFTSLGLTSVWRAVSLIAGVVATMPLRTFREVEPGRTELLKSFLDNPAGPESATPFEWKETVMAHLLLHGNAFLVHIYGGAGQIVGLLPVHPSCVGIEYRPDLPGGKLFRVSLIDGTYREFTAVDLTHIPGLSTDGLRGLSPIHVARNALGTGIAGDSAAARMFANGMMVSGLVTPEEDLTEDEAITIKESLRRKVLGHEHAGDIAVINRKLKFDRWSLSAEDAQFIESRQFQIDEVARIFGVPKVLLAEDGASTWGSGIAELVRGFTKFTLTPWTHRIEERLSMLLPNPRFVRFEMTELLRGSPEEESALVLAQVNGGLVTVNEGRARLKLAPVAGGDSLRLPPGSNPPPESSPPPAAEEVDVEAV